ncbi:MAG: 6,7-dimethyl-8-ribityllumazine synthase [Rhizomicrobium sp.]
MIDKPNILIVEARFYPHISDLLLDGATAALEKGGARFERLAVPGALEIPIAVGLAARAADHGGKSYDGFIALGCVIRGETYHFEIVSNESARGLTDLGIAQGLCIGNGILTVENERQALERADPGDGDKGGDAARACLALVAMRARFGVHR